MRGIYIAEYSIGAMASFNLVVVSVAVVILIITLAYMGSVMSAAKTNLVFPPVANVCPDNWTANAAGTLCSTPAAGTGRANAGALTGASANVVLSGEPPNSVLSINPAATTWASSGKSSICGKSAWANANGVVWDGISNYNSC